MKRESVFLMVGLAAAMAGACRGSGGGESAAPGDETAAAEPAAETTADACAAVSQSEIEQAVGNPVLKGAPYAGPEVCKWDT